MESQQSSMESPAVNVPIRGLVPSRYPFQMMAQARMLPVPRHELEGRVANVDSLYAVRAVGDSLHGDGIHDNDYLIVDSAGVIEDGNIYIVRTQDDDVVARHLYKEDGKFRLEATNTGYPVLRVTGEVMGRVILSFRLKEV